MAKIPQPKVNSFEAFTISFSECLPVFRLYKSIEVKVANALISEAVDDIAADKITANNNPINPFGKYFKIHYHRKTK